MLSKRNLGKWLERGGRRWAALVAIVLLLLAAAGYSLRQARTIDTAAISDAQWCWGVSRSQAKILLDRPGQALGLHPGDALRLRDGTFRHVRTIPASTGPFFEVALNAPIGCDAGPIKLVRAHVSGPLRDLAATCAFVFCCGWFFYGLGAALLRRSDVLQHDPVNLRAGAALFLGCAAFLTSWRVAAKALGSACWAALIVAALGALTVFLLRRRADPPAAALARQQRAFVPTLGLLYVLLTCYVGALWLAHSPANLYVASGQGAIGAFEANRYANIASFVAATDAVPVLKQSYGQSLLAALPSLVGLPFPHLSLLCWLAFFMAALLLFADGWAQRLGATPGGRAFTFIVLLCGGPRATLLTTEVTDNHSTPLAFNGYADTLFGLGCATCLVLLVQEATYRRVQMRTQCQAALVALVLASVMPLCAIHMLVVTLFACGMQWLAYACKRDWPKCVATAMCTAAMGLGAVATARLGGMLAPDSALAHDLIPGLMQAPPADGATLTFLIDSQMVRLIDPSRWHFYSTARPFVPAQADWSSIAQVYENLALMEERLWDLSRSLFFPLLALALARPWIQAEGSDARRRRDRQCLVGAVLSCCACGLAFAAFLTVNTVHHELLRFMNQGYFYGMFLFAQVGWPAPGHAHFARARRSIVLLSLASCAGPLAGIGLQMYGAYRRLNVAQKIQFVTGAPPFSDGYHPSQQAACRKVGPERGTQVTVCTPP